MHKARQLCLFCSMHWYLDGFDIKFTPNILLSNFVSAIYPNRRAKFCPTFLEKNSVQLEFSMKIMNIFIMLGI